MGVTFHSICVDTGDEHEGFLVLNDRDALVGVLVYLSDQYDCVLKGHWFLEVGFGKYDGEHPTFSTIEEAKAWFENYAERK